MSKKKSAVNKAIDSFVNSIHETGEGYGAITSIVFILGGLFATYIGYTDASIILLAGGLITILIGLVKGYKEITQSTEKVRRRR